MCALESTGVGGVSFPHFCCTLFLWKDKFPSEERENVKNDDVDFTADVGGTELERDSEWIALSFMCLSSLENPRSFLDDKTLSLLWTGDVAHPLGTTHLRCRSLRPASRNNDQR